MKAAASNGSSWSCSCGFWYVMDVLSMIVISIVNLLWIVWYLMWICQETEREENVSLERAKGATDALNVQNDDEDYEIPDD